MPYARDLKDPQKRELLPFKFAEKKEQNKLLADICNKKETNAVDDEEGDCESDEGAIFMNEINARDQTGAQGSEAF